MNTEITGISISGKIENLAFRSGNEIIELPLYSSTRSTPVTYSGPAIIHFFDKNDTTETSLGSVDLSNYPAQKVLLIAIKQPTTNTYDFLCYPDNLVDFPAGSYRILNRSSNAIEVKIGDEQVRIEKNEYGNLRGNFDHAKHYATKIVALLPEDKTRNIYSGKVFYSDLLRFILILYTPDESSPKEIKFSTIIDAVKTDK